MSMTIIIPDSYAQTTVLWASPDLFISGNGATVIGHRCPGNDVQAANTVLVEEITDHLLPIIDSGILCVSIRTITALLSFETPVQTAGGRSGTSAPPNVATLVRKATIGRGRRRQGRMFLPGCVTNQDVGEDGVIATARRDLIQDALTAMRQGMEASGCEMVILHNEEGETPAPIPTDVNDLIVEQRVASQRQRLR